MNIIATLMIAAGICSAAWVAADLARQPPQPMSVMKCVWPLNALWFGPFGVVAYRMIGRTLSEEPRIRATGSARSMKSRVLLTRAARVLHGDQLRKVRCIAAQVVRSRISPVPLIFAAFPFAVIGCREFGVDAGLRPGTGDRRELQVCRAGSDAQTARSAHLVARLQSGFASLTAWQVNGWMGFAIFGWNGSVHLKFTASMAPSTAELVSAAGALGKTALGKAIVTSLLTAPEA